MIFRFATVQDKRYASRDLCAVYRNPHYLRMCPATEQAFADRIHRIVQEYPYLVWEDDSGRVLGYAYAHRQMERAAYQWNAELSIYLDRAHTSQGWGKKMYLALMDLLALQGVKTVYGGVTIPNEKSERLHACLGFQRLGTYHNTGYKCGRWHDVAWFERPYLLTNSTAADRWDPGGPSGRKRCCFAQISLNSYIKKPAIRRLFPLYCFVNEMMVSISESVLAYSIFTIVPTLQVTMVS